MTEEKALLHAVIRERVFVCGGNRQILDEGMHPSPWMFDFKRILLDPQFLDAYARLFLKEHDALPVFQVAGLESGALPLISAIVLQAHKQGKDVSGFFIRRSRKKNGTQNRIEGAVTAAPIILIDDIVHSGRSFMDQVGVLRTYRHEHPTCGDIIEVSAILAFRGEGGYRNLSAVGVRTHSFFELNDFTDTLGVENEVVPSALINPIRDLEVVWHWKGGRPTYVPVLPKSDPVIVGTRMFSGTDDGAFVCIDVRTGEEVWRYAIPNLLRARITFTNAVPVGSNICFGGSDGNFYALSMTTGKRVWVSFDADWIYGHPAYDAELGLVFAPLSFGLKGKQGSVVAFDALTGTARWTCTMSAPVMGGITAVPTLDMIIFGTEDGHIYGVEASTGKYIWEQTVDLQPRGAPVIDAERGQVFITGVRNPNSREDEQGALYALSLKAGKEHFVWRDFRFGTFSTPALFGSTLFFTSLDGFLYALDASKGALVWKRSLEARSLASPLVIGPEENGEVSLVVGSNNGRLLVVDIETGKERSVTHLSERIVNACVYAQDEDILIVPTQGNEFYALAKRASYTHESDPA